MAIGSIDELEAMLSEPGRGVVDMMGRLEGDIVALGAGGKMGPSLARMAKRASDAAGTPRRIVAASLAWSDGEEERLLGAGVETATCDLMESGAIERLPDAPNVVFMVGLKFGTTGREGLTWALNAFLPGLVCRRYPRSRIVVFSTGNVYGLTPIALGGSVESDTPNPAGEYAMSALGRERVFEHFSVLRGTPVAVVRLNYAVEMRYGVLADIARKVWAGEPVDVSMGAVNVIWQADASAMALMALEHASSPPFVVNVAGPEMLNIRRVAERFASLMGKQALISGQEADTALLSNGQRAHALFGYPRVSVGSVIEWVADWVMRGGESLGKPTHFQDREGRF